VRKYWGEKIVLLDDDLDFYWRADPKDWHLTTPPPIALENMFAEIEWKLNDYAHVGVSGREGNNRVMDYAVQNTRYMRLLAYNTALWPESIMCDRLDGMSDFDTNMQLLRAGLPGCVFFRWAQGQRSTQSPGGCSLYRTNDSHAAEVVALCDLHPGLVTPRYKRNRSGGLFGHRDEVTVAWQLALGWDARKGAIVSPTERMARELAEARRRIAELERELQSYYRDDAERAWRELENASTSSP
jgi:hypothetical protein